MPGAAIVPGRNPEDFWLSKALRNATSLDTPGDQSLGHDVAEFGAGFVPGVGQAMALRDIERARRDNDYVGMGLSAASLIPGGHLLKALRGGKEVGQQLIAGRRALKAPQRALDEAEALKRAGEKPQTQWERTQAYVGADKQPKWEISDLPSKVTYDHKRSGLIDWADDLTLGDIFHHPEMYENYPHLKDMKVWGGVDPSHQGNAAYHPSLGKGDAPSISIHARDPEEFHSNLLHEIQHAIQEVEPGFSRGANVGEQKDRLMKAYKDSRGMPPMSTTDLKQIEKDAAGAYRHNMGEAEARAVQRRWANALRHQAPPYSYDIPDYGRLWHESSGPPLPDWMK